MRTKPTIVAVLAVLACLAVLVRPSAEGAAAAAKARRLTPAQQATLAKAVAGFAPMRVDVFIFGDTPEITTLTADISAALRQGGWRPKLWAQANSIAYGVVGVPVFAHGEGGPGPDAAATALTAALKGQGIISAKVPPFHGTDAPDRVFEDAWDKADLGEVRVYVGLNPE